MRRHLHDGELGHQLRGLHRELAAIGIELTRNLRYLTSLVAAFPDVRTENSLHILNELADGCTKLGHRLTGLGETLRATTHETVARELLCLRRVLHDSR